MDRRGEIERLLGEPVTASPPGSFLPFIRRIDTERLRASAERFGTPQYCLDLDRLRERAGLFARTMRSHLPASECFYAFKCNDLPLLVKTLKEAGFQADVAGIFELELALRLGFERILFSGPGKSADELALAARNGDRVTVIVDNMDELRLLADVAAREGAEPALRIGFRLRGIRSPRAGGNWSKFGIALDRLPGAIRVADDSPRLDWAGLHFHASWNRTPRAYEENIARIGGFLGGHIPGDRLRRMRFFDVGGGFYPEGTALLARGTDRGTVEEILAERRRLAGRPGEETGFDPDAFVMTEVAPIDEFASAIAGSVRTHIEPLAPGAAVYLEPGRFIAAHSTTILLTVTAVKPDCVIVDGGINMLGDSGPAEYAFAPIVNLSRPGDGLSRRTVCGPLCDPADLWGRIVYGGEPLAGDLLAVLHQGAYTFSTAWRFIKPIPRYVACSGGRLALARETERFDDRYAGCRF
ncbi:MAG: alanine racemase [Candidatus Krumholzibacteriota bacterium]|nr:alanine racemase [Candidatus Krumholzibacteriota bacterium]